MKIQRKRFQLSAENSVALDYSSIKIKATTTTKTKGKINFEKQSVKRKHEDGHEYPLKLTHKCIKNLQISGD